MLKSQQGFTPMLSLIIILIIGALGFTGWQVWAQRTSHDTPASQATPVDGDSQSTASGRTALTLTLIDQATARPVTHAKVHVDSNDGTDCKTSPCPANNKSWDGTSDAHGRVQLPAEIVQYVMQVSVAGYSAAAYRYVQDAEQATLQLQK